MKARALAIVAAALFAVGTASADEPKDQWNVGGDLGARWTVIRSAGFGPFSSDDLFSQLDLDAWVVLARKGPISIAGLAGYAFGQSDAKARGMSASLTVHRLSLGGEARFDLGPLVQPFVRIAPSAVHVRAELDDSGAPSPLRRRTWTWGGDLTAGARVAVVRFGDPVWPSARIWAVGDVGWSFAGEVDMKLAPQTSPDDPRTFDETTLPPLRPGGFLVRVGAGVSF